MGKPVKVLFICKKNEIYGWINNTRRSSGLYNSTRFITEALNEYDCFNAKIVEVVDNNSIDREVTQFRPDVVVIEALWVVPEKFDVLRRLHPRVKWFCHLHSNMPFLAMEGMAMDWIQRYPRHGVKLIANSEPSYKALQPILQDDDLFFLPNVYLGAQQPPKVKTGRDTTIHIGCFGAVRPLKNHLIQALAAIRFAKEMGYKLKFYINATRVETGGQPVLKNLKQLFDLTPHTTLVEVHWCEPEEFISILRDKIDIGMQVSLTETFSVVSADYTTAGIPMVISKEIYWASKLCVAKDDNIDSIVKLMRRVWQSKLLVRRNQKLLSCHASKATKKWATFFLHMVN